MPARVASEHPVLRVLASATLLLLAAPTAVEAARGSVPYDPARYLRAREMADAGDLGGAAAETVLLLAPLPQDLAALELAATCDPAEARAVLEAARLLHPVVVFPDPGAGTGCLRLLFGLYGDEASVRAIVRKLPPRAVPAGARGVRLRRDEAGSWSLTAGEQIPPGEAGRDHADLLAKAPPRAVESAPPPRAIESAPPPRAIESAPPPRAVESAPTPRRTEPAAPSAVPEAPAPAPAVEPPAPPPRAVESPAPLDVQQIYEAQVEFQRGRESLLARDLDEADASFRRVVGIDPTNAPAWNNIGTIALLRKDYPEAVKAFSEALRIDPRYARAHLNLATGLYGIGRTEEALQELKRAEALEPRSFDVHFNCAALLAEQGRFNDALDSLETALAISPGDSKAVELKRLIVEEMERRSLVRHPKKPDGLARELGTTAGELQVLPEDAPAPASGMPPVPPAGEAVTAPSAPTGRPPESEVRPAPPTASARASVAEGQTRIPPPSSLLRPAGPPPVSPAKDAAGAGSRTEADTRFERGKRFYDRGDYRAAAAEFEKAREMDPGNGNVHNNLGVVYLMQERYPSAIEEFRRTLELDPGNIRARINLGGAYYNLGQVEDAIAALEEAERLAPQDPEVAYNLALFYSGADRTEQARRAIQHAAGLDPFDPRIRALQAALPGTPETAYVTEPTVFVRDGPGRAFRTLTRVHHGDAVLVLQKRPEWWKVRTVDGLEGWVASALLAIGQPGR